MRTMRAVEGVLIGTAVGDALGLPHEGLGPERIAKRLTRGGLRHGMLGGRGLLSDDTEHASMVARALAQSRGDGEAFARSFAAQLRRWLLSLPPGIGLATLRASVRLCLGLPPSRSGVDSAGNGPLMRAALLGVWAEGDGQLADLVRVSSRMTHTDPRAEDGALLVARLARQLAAGSWDLTAADEIRDPEFRARVEEAAQFEGDLRAFRETAGFERGVSGFVVHTLTAVVWCVREPDPVAALERAVRLGGDTDTVAAIVGALVGARDGVQAWPTAWVEGIVDWPLRVETLWALADALVHDRPPPSQRWVAALPRNLALVVVIFGHLGLRALGR